MLRCLLRLFLRVADTLQVDRVEFTLNSELVQQIVCCQSPLFQTDTLGLQLKGRQRQLNVRLVVIQLGELISDLVAVQTELRKPTSLVGNLQLDTQPVGVQPGDRISNIGSRPAQPVRHELEFSKVHVQRTQVRIQVDVGPVSRRFDLR